MMTPERRVKKVVTDQLKKLGAYYFYPVTGGYGASGVPDIVGCYRGRFFAIECKAGRNRPTELQTMQIEKIQNQGGIAWIVNEENMNDVAATLQSRTEK